MSSRRMTSQRASAEWQNLSADEQLRLVTGLHSDVDILKVINAFAIELITIPNREELAWYIGREVVGKLGFADCVIYYLDVERGLLCQTAAIGEEKNPVSDEIVNALEIPVGSGITGTVAATKTPLIIDDLLDDARYIPDVEPARSEICVPLFIDDDVVGVIDCESPEVAAFDEFHMEILTTVAAMASAKLKNLQQDQAVKTAERLTDLLAAVESISEPLAIFDEDDRFTYTNKAYHELNRVSLETIEVGTRFEDHLRAMVAKGAIADAVGCEERWLTERMEVHRRDKSAFELRGAEGRWLLALEERLPSGGQVIILTDITELKDAQTEAERASLAKTVFLSSMSHELRTPMNAILGFAQVLERIGKDTLTARQKQCVDQILGSGSHMLRLIEDSLELSTIEAGSVEIGLADVVPREIIEDILRWVRSRADGEDIEIRNGGIEDADIPVRADPTRLKQILVNLLTNAIKYNHAGGEVTVRAERIGDTTLRVSVADTGLGMSEKQKQSVFDPFNRLGHEGGEIEGTGIGLTIAKRLADLMGAELGFESLEKVGSTFWIDLPISDGRGT